MAVNEDILIQKATSSESQSVRKFRIEASKGWISLGLREVWAYRELLYFLVWRDVKVRYKQTALGAAWVIIQPVMTMIVFSIFFGKLGKIPSDGIPYPLFSFAGLLPWGFFAGGLGKASDSLVGSSNLIKKVYFPRLIIPLSSALSGLPDFGIAFLVMLAIMLFYGVIPSFLSIFLLPLFLILALITSLGVGLWLSALNVKYRDIRYTVPFIVQFWMFATPIAYPASLIPEPWRTVFAINPMVGVVEGFRWLLVGTGSAPGPVFIVSTLASLAILVSGAYFFRRSEKKFADIV